MLYGFLFSFLLSIHSYAATWDAVGVYHNPDKVVVQINEPGAQGQPSSRLQNWMDLFLGTKPVQSLYFLSDDESLKINCHRDSKRSSCVMRFFPGEDVRIFDRGVEATISPEALSVLGFQPPAEAFDISFLNSNGDHFRIWIDTEGRTHLWGEKKSRP